ncbi:SNF2 family N-terminal domain-containing protein [Paecilomyces variotii]|uniref:SNF2 family N-terminal domain-containing protein n=1 Tax=Byssochlamys spectabilis TaxID=264951 RepID=A0A443I2Q3_BYSSP|nr:SNF2 family N-terminal domain-containing protein [Paecilomyces variotii]KAJ9247520.1 hypothetical protein DTO207G8_7986 [Paecilomyces variotii]KAJ9360976.1 hypothetical protein DTO280E4_4187 [Paecilomyces variotii]KAJ9390702.1 hypothetical protein DTO063F5_1652 [Paecilomyces variotii]RWQ98335.1 SNF2 family N-terminal domain-containing protein [Paecilomyces variotii]
MAVVRGEVSLPGPVPEQLATAFAQCQETEPEGPPSKRRKLADGETSSTNSPRSLDSNARRPIGYITLARILLDLSYAESIGDFGQGDSSPNERLAIPVFIRSVGALAGDREFKLELATVQGKRVLFQDTIRQSEITNLGAQLQLLSGLVSTDRARQTQPLVCYQSTLHALSDRKSFQLELNILWKDSLEIPRRFPKEARLILQTYVPYGLPEYPSTVSHVNGQKKVRATWSPRDFYDNVHVPERTPAASADIKCDLIQCQLYPFQTRAVRWLLQREGMQLQPDGKVVPAEPEPSEELPDSFYEFTDADGRRCFASHLFLTVTTNLSGWKDAGRYLKGGILAEEMGLGKTVEMISLMCLNQRPLTLSDEGSSTDSKGLLESRATLIITPPAILEQWKQEINTHSPGLRVLHYTGIPRNSESLNEDLVKTVANNDVVLTTYNVLSREVHYAGDAPRPNLRHQKRFEVRKTPLVQISWWRVCLDEAQMIESGVSNAARVARVIPRQNAWAVTGTPLRKDIKDLFGLLLFLHYQPFSDGLDIWTRLYENFKPVFRRIIGKLALRHSKDRIRDELRLPPQRRVVITVPFTPIEEQHYGHLYEQMCEDCGLDNTGTPLSGDWDPNSQAVIDKMRSWLTRLRQTCLHPEVAGGNRRAFGVANGPLRSVNEVLEVMIDQNDTLIRTEERALLLSQTRRGQLLENAHRGKEALQIWQNALARASEIVQDCRDQLQAEREKERAARETLDNDTASVDTTSDKEDGEETAKNSRIGTYRAKLRAALEVQHICTFFTGNAYYQIKTDRALTEPDSKEFKELGKLEEEAYEAAKQIRKEILYDISQKAGRYMKTIRQKSVTKSLVHIPNMKPHLYSSGLEGRRLFERFEDFCDALNRHAVQYNEWRDSMIKLLLQPLVDEEENELEGNEYETSTKHQDEMYVYMEALRAMFADRNDAITGQRNVLIAHEIKSGIIQAEKGEGPSPELFRNIMNTRSKIKPDPTLGSLRGIISELRSLATSLEWQESGGSSRAKAELEIVNQVLANASQMATEQAKVISGLEREVEMFRDTMNNRLEYYRQLQQISDTVAPYDEESVGKPMNEELFAAKLKQESQIDGKISGLKAKRRYLIHLREEPGSEDSSRICVICQSSFEIGVLTVCGHKYCKDCLRLWWHQHRTCPTCKKRLKVRDFHQITYKPQDLVIQEEKPPVKPGSDRSPNKSIYTDVSSDIMREIKNIDLDGYFGTKIDTLARHLIWLRQNDPGSKSIVFSQYKHFLSHLGVAFSRFKIGHISVDNKDGIERFKSDPAIECFLLHAKAHSSGLNLVNATHVFLCEPLINTAIELQAIARVHRIGQHRPTTIWMYLVSDTVEETIYDISVSRRLTHIVQREKEKGAQSPTSDSPNGATVQNLSETAIDSANSLELQDATLSRLMTGGSAGGEIVRKDDLWQCLFGKANRSGTPGHSLEAEREVGRFLRAEAAEERKKASTVDSSIY